MWFLSWAFDHKGGLLHMIWLRVSELSLILPFVSMFLDWDAD